MRLGFTKLIDALEFHMIQCYGVKENEYTIAKFYLFSPPNCVQTYKHPPIYTN